MSGFGTFDMAGNVKEWCWNEDGHHRRYILGGGWNESDYMFGEADAYFPIQRSPSFGFRCVKYSKDNLPTAATAPLISSARNYDEKQPVSQEIFQIYKSLYSYDKTALNAATEMIDEATGSISRCKILICGPRWRRKLTESLKSEILQGIRSLSPARRVG